MRGNIKAGSFEISEPHVLKHRVRLSLFAWGLVVLAILVAAAPFIASDANTSTSAAPSDSDSSTPISEETRPGTSPGNSSPTPASVTPTELASSPTVASGNVAPLFLSDTEPVAAQGIGSHSTSATIDKVPYPHSVAQFQSRCSESGEPKQWEYSIGANYQSFSAWIGLDDNNRAADLSVTFEIYADGKPVYEKRVTAGAAIQAHIDVLNVRRLKLVSSFSISTNCNSFDEAVWGNAKFS
ncbi:NPCBM/NEW2 domain-containing protein [Streptomyces sp. NPDC058274]|uniref:NPCBM/NEW2 domain-containing protein n=1 Tax=Streptomyces sp. NPDC058274 TaxID=3346416 RepID=UPI0036EABC37